MIVGMIKCINHKCNAGYQASWGPSIGTLYQGMLSITGTIYPNVLVKPDVGTVYPGMSLSTPTVYPSVPMRSPRTTVTYMRPYLGCWKSHLSLIGLLT